MRLRFASGLTPLVLLLACSSSKSDSSNPSADSGLDSGNDSGVEHEPACDPTAYDTAATPLGPSTRVITVVPKTATALAATGKNPSTDHDAIVAYLAQGLGDWATGPGEDDGVVDALLPGAGSSKTLAGRKSLAYFAHFSDFQLVDDESPERAMNFDAPDIQGAARPEEAGVARVGSAMHRTLTALTKGHRAFDFEIVTGDCADSAQKNEQAWFVQLMDGTPGLNTDSGDDDDPVIGPNNDVKDPFDPTPAPAPWYYVYGNHDTEIQGNLVVDVSTFSIASGTTPALGTRDYRLAFAPVTTDEIPPDEARDGVTREQIVSGLLASPSAPGPVGHGFKAGGAVDNYIIDPIPNVPIRIIELDTTDPAGGSNGQVLQSTVDSFLTPALTQAESEGKLVLLATHHATTEIDNGAGGTTDPLAGALTGTQVEAIVAAHPNVIAWLVGHNHRNRVRTIKGPSADAPGYYEIMTDAIADWPSESRAIEIIYVPGTTPSLSIDLTMIDYQANDCLESRFRALSLVDAYSGFGQNGFGDATSRNVELRRAVPKGVTLDALGVDRIETETTLLGK